MDDWLAILLLIIGFAIYFCVYLIVPWIIALSSKFAKPTIDLIVLANTVVVFVFFQLINPNLTTNLSMGVITLYIARKRMLSKCLKPDSNDPRILGTKLTMNPNMGKKWFIFYARVRPWLSFVSFLALLVTFIEYPFTFANSAALLIYCIGSLIQTCMAFRVFIWSRRDYQTFVSIVEDVLFFETIFIPYQVAVVQYQQNGNNLNESIVVGIIILILTYLLWYRLNVKYFRSRLFVSPDVPIESTPHMSLSNAGEKPLNSSFNATYGADLYVVPKSELSPIKEAPQNTPHKVKPTQVQPNQSPPPSQKRIKYCSRCGKPIDPDTKKCQGCGKQYFKGISIRKSAPLILLFLATASMVCCFCLFVRLELQEEQISEQKREIVLYKKDISDLEEQVKELEKDKDTWYNYWKRNYRKVNFFDEHVVLVEDDGTGFYHKYDCSKFKGNYFWAYNKEAADDRGYRPCPDCHK